MCDLPVASIGFIHRGVGAGAYAVQHALHRRMYTFVAVAEPYRVERVGGLGVVVVVGGDIGQDMGAQVGLVRVDCPPVMGMFDQFTGQGRVHDADRRAIDSPAAPTTTVTATSPTSPAQSRSSWPLGMAVMGHNQARRWGVHALIESRREEIRALCKRLGIRRLDVFGSAVGSSFDVATSDIDVLVEFDTDRPGFDYFGTYFTLKEGLEQLLGRAVDVVSVTSIRNPYFRDRVMRTRESLYAA